MKRYLLIALASTSIFSGCGSDSNGTDGSIEDDTVPKYTIGGQIAGLSGSLSTLSIELNGIDRVQFSEDLSYTFTSSLIDSADYDVQLVEVPDGYSCEFTNANNTGAIAATNINDLDVLCEKHLWVSLTGTPDPSIVFNNIDRTFYYNNNLSNGIWVVAADLIITGHFMSNGYYSHSPSAGGYSSHPENDVANHYGTMLHMPASNTVYRELTNQASHPTASLIQLGTIDPQTGAMSNWANATFSDDFSGTCYYISSSATDLYCYDGSGIRQYTTQEGSATLTFVRAINLSQTDFTYSSTGWSGTFAWDGMYFYFPHQSTDSGNISYYVYDSEGIYVNAYSFESAITAHGVYFDWSIGRYTTHDGFGNFGGGTQYTFLNGGFTDDSQAYMGPSAYHK